MKRAVFWALVLLLMLYCLFPFAWTLLSALKPPKEVFALPIVYWPATFSTQSFTDVFLKRDFGTYILNSFVVSGGGTLLTIVLAALTAFYLRQLPVVRALALQRWLLTLAILPPTLLVIPLFVAIKELGLVNNYLGLIAAYTFLNYPFAVWMLYAAFGKIPKSLDEAALMDGFGKTGILLRLLLPLAKPSVAVASLFVFIFNWNEFLLALTLMPEEKMYTVPVAISMLSGASVYELPWGEINAAVTITTLPLIVMVVLFQKWIVSGLTSGSVKG
jgi:ABC-type glycerol-3-phosphate transport system permease component